MLRLTGLIPKQNRPPVNCDLFPLAIAFPPLSALASEK
jgi:hypothetical protein